MNPNILKDFLIQAWDFNQSLEKPFYIFYKQSTTYYDMHNEFIFSEINDIKMKNRTQQEYVQLVNSEIQQQLQKKDATKKIRIDGIKFIEAYFPFYFEKHPENQIHLLKFFNSFGYRTSKTSIDFLFTYEKKTIEPLINQINSWFDFNRINYDDFDDLLIQKGFDLDFRILFFKKNIEANLKQINKTPYFSKNIMNFLLDKYPNKINYIAPNVAVIQKNNQNIDFSDFSLSFNNQPTIYIGDTINIEKILTTFQIPGWNLSLYSEIISKYNSHLENKINCKIKTFTSQNYKNSEIIIQLKENNFTIQEYKKQLFVLFNFCKNNHETSLEKLKSNLDNIFLNASLSENLPNQKKTITNNKI